MRCPLLARNGLLVALAAGVVSNRVGERQEGPVDEAAWSALLARCGSEMDWAPDWASAAARAEAEKKPVLAVAWLYPGFDIPDGVRLVFALDEALIELVGARCVPLRLGRDSAVPFGAPERYGLSGTAFGAALLLVSPAGDVLAQSSTLDPLAAWDFLSRALGQRPEWSGDAVDAAVPALKRARRHLARGELEDARAALGLDGKSEASEHGQWTRDAAAQLVLARVARRQRDVPSAQTALKAGRTALAEHGAGESESAAEIEREALEMDLERGLSLFALARATSILDEHPATEAAHEALYVLGLLARAGGDAKGADEHWSALVRAHPDCHWALEAAATRAHPELRLSRFVPECHGADLLDSLAELPWSPAAEPQAALADGLRWLAEHRRANGTWPDPSELSGGTRATNSLSAGVDALARRALLVAWPDVDPAQEARELVAAARASVAANGGSASYMTYDVWSHALLLEGLLDVLERGAPREDVLPVAAELAGALGARQRPNGGWSYFETTSLATDAARPQQSISFVTATVVLALRRARDAGVEVDFDALERGLDALEAMRSDEGVFAYMLWSHQERAPAELRVAGAAGRGPLCELALLHGGRSDRERLERALEIFFAHASTLDRERGKALMHCGEEGQGCHYVLYDHALAARALGEIPAKRRRDWPARLRALVLAARRTDGSFQDTPILGAACGTALAVLALRELDDAPR